MSVHLVVEDDAVDIRLTGLDAVAALRTHLRIAMDDVTGVHVVPTSEARRSVRWRVGGTAVPGLVMAGWYTQRERPGARQWWSTYRDDEVLVIDTRLERPSRVVVQHPDRHDLAWFIGERLHSPGPGA
jgi:hypothetical protein